MKIAIIGYGKMGKMIEEIALQRGHTIVLKVNIDNTEDFTKENISKADVAIEFTGPSTAFDNVKQCIEFGIPVVSGSTGWNEKITDIKKLTTEKGGSFLHTSNFSIGVNIFFELNKKLAELMSRQPDYDVSMVEIHHTQKLDAPSGTAVTLAEQIMGKVSSKTRWVNQPSTKNNELQIISERIDPAAGVHKVKYTSDIDEIEIIHSAHNRKGFALGAVMAAEFINKKKGVYTMDQVLGL